MAPSHTRALAVALAAAVSVAACSSNGGGDDRERGAASGGDDGEPAGTTCGLLPPATGPVDTGTLAGDLIQVSSETYECAEHVVVAESTDEIIVGAQLAAALGGPLLMPDQGLGSEMERLRPAHVHVVGTVDNGAPGDAELHTLTVAEAADLTATTLDAGAPASLPSELDGTAVAEVIQSISAGDSVLALEPEAAGGSPEGGGAEDDAAEPAAPDIDLSATLAELPAPEGDEDVWLVAAAEPWDAVALAPMASARGAAVVPVDGADLFRHADIGRLLTDQDADSVRLIGDISADVEWQLPVITAGHELPGGGFELFPDDFQRTFIAFYGHPDSAAMGALGQQDGPESTHERMQPLLDDYAEHSDAVVPTFNVIATVAHNGGSTSRPDEIVDFDSPRYVDYSTMHPPSRFTGWAEAAAEADGYFMMDFQPGRNDFLYQVRHYEELIRLPHTGIALDPEWRLGPGQEHLQQIGHVTVDEVNEVIEWLADLVRAEGLPPKILLLHQFRLSMLPDRDEIIDRDEVAVVIQMDGEGQTSLAQKDETWRTITAGTEDSHWDWGWKNFFERDTPGPNSPEDTMSKEPTPVYVSYQ